MWMQGEVRRDREMQGYAYELRGTQGVSMGLVVKMRVCIL